MTQAEKLSELYPGTTTLELSHGKVVRIGALTLGTLLEAEEEYGSADELLANLAKDKPSPKDILSIFWLLVKNKSDFANAKDLADHVPVKSLLDGTLIAAITSAAAASMPKAQEGGEAATKGTTKKGNRTGGTTSRRSAATTAATI